MKSYHKRFDFSKVAVDKTFIGGTEVRVSFATKSGELCIGTLSAGKWVSSQSFKLKLNGEKFLRQEFLCPTTKVEVVADIWPADSSVVMVVSR